MRGRKATGKKKTNLTLSIDDQIFNEIKNDAEKRGISINLLANELLTRYMIFYKHYEALKGVGIPGIIFKEMIDVVEEKQMIRWLNMANNELWPSVMIRDNIPTTIENFVDYSFGNVAKRAGLFSNFKHYIDEKGFFCLVFEHEFGMKWSKSISEVFSESLMNLFQVEVERKVLANTVLIRILERDLEKITLKL